MDNIFIANLLTELLAEYNRVSLPCLGSFIGQYKPAFIDNKNNVIYPPSKQISFFQNEIWNDERLEQLIALRKNISLGEAKEQLAFWIDGVCVALSDNKVVDLPSVGYFQVSKGNKLNFIQYHEKNFLLESFGLNKIDIEAIPSSPTLPPQPVAPFVEIKKILPSVNKKKKRTGLWVTVCVLAIILLLLALIHFRIIPMPQSIIDKYPSIENYLSKQTIDERSLFQPNTENTEQIKPQPDTLKNHQTATIGDSLHAQSQDTTTHNPTTHKEHYHIVAASAAGLSEAREQAKQWAQKGIVAQTLYIAHEQRYIVSIGTFDNKDTANAKLEEYKNIYGNSLYIFTSE